MERSKFGLLCIIAGVLLYLAILQDIAKNDWEDVSSRTDIEVYCATHDTNPNYGNCIDFVTGTLKTFAFGKVISVIFVLVGLALFFKKELIVWINFIDRTLKETYEKDEPDNNNQADKLVQLEKLGELKNKGLLSEEEFQKEKDRILNP